MKGVDLDAVDLTAVVEDVARDFYDRRMASLEEENPGSVSPGWEHLNAMSAHSIRAAVLQIGRAHV